MHSAASAAHESFVTRSLAMSWTTPEVKEVCVGMEVNDYLPAEF
ncbi:coenzyme PQQ precursor peptide PqqA [Kushneria phosphatilytica]|nr:coenzyme PQQ precursor peptide PqqA [Kushneria phosphatilytica]